MTGMIEFNKLDKTPNCAKDKTHHYCDYVELIALVNGSDGVSNSDIYDRFLEDDRIASIGSELGAEVNESWVSSIDTWITEIRSRIIAYEECYPFLFCDGRIVRKAELTERNHIYIGLLLCSCLRNFDNTSILSSSFEYASFCAMKKYLPNIAEVHIFGVSSGTVGRYTGSLEIKMRKLAGDTGYNLKSRPNLFRRVDNGDGGADIVAWVPFNNDSNMDKKLFFIGQSASTMAWPDKQHSGERIKSYLDIENTVLNVLYVPYDMRDYDRNIQEWGQVTTDILFDRQRMINLLDPEDLFSGNIGQQFKSVIEYAASYSEGIV